MKISFLKISISNLLLIVTIVALLVAWRLDHRRLMAENEKRNAEATEIFTKYWMATRGGGSALVFPRPSKKSAYLFSSPEDRAAMLEMVGEPFLIDGPLVPDSEKADPRSK
jgi:hypothetical protein